MTGANERALREAGLPYQAVHLHPNSHAGYYPGAQPLALKLLFDPDSGRLLGGQAVGHEGVDKRIDVLATALKARMTVYDLAQLELAYAPPFGSAKDPINIAGMIAENTLAGDVTFVPWDDHAVTDTERVLLDVREREEWGEGGLPGSLHIPLTELRTRLDELPQHREIMVYCRSGQRAYYACRLLSQQGIRCRCLSGGYLTWAAASEESFAPSAAVPREKAGAV
jgi:rhodanese-related sulfurtransferase